MNRVKTGMRSLRGQDHQNLHNIRYFHNDNARYAHILRTTTTGYRAIARAAMNRLKIEKSLLSGCCEMRIADL